MIYYELEPWALTHFYVKMALLGFRRDFSKIHDSVDIVQVVNKMKPCGVKNLSSTLLLFFDRRPIASNNSEFFVF